VGGPINVWFDDSQDDALGSVEPETPVHDDEQHEAGHVADLMVRSNDVPPPYRRTRSPEL